MKIVIFCGGTGSIALQRGLYQALDAQLDGIETTVIVNAYDNGLSSGAVRRVLDGRILAPSDVRKNQATRVQLVHPDSPWLSFLNHRFSAEASDARDICDACLKQLLRQLERLDTETDHGGLLYRALATYFDSPIARNIDYHDFSIANIVYAGLAKANDNSLRMAARIMAGAMSIPDSTILNDDQSLFLGATTASGRRISDEGDIVSWGNETDPFVDTFFYDADGKPSAPQLCLEAWQAIVEADLIILSTGTLWSSLIPTYASNGFKAAIDNSNAKLIMVMNRVPDKDSPGQTASDIVDALVPRYFSPGRLHVIADEQSNPAMNRIRPAALEKLAQFSEAELSTKDTAPDKHDSGKLVNAIGKIFFGDYIDTSSYLFDYDDTLIGRGNRYPKSSRFNIKGISELNKLANVGVCTGNTIRAVRLPLDPPANEASTAATARPLLVFADGGINKYTYNNGKTNNQTDSDVVAEMCIWPEALIPTDGLYSTRRIIDALIRSGISPASIDNRGNAVIAIRPVRTDQRQALLFMTRHLIAGSDLVVRETGRTTIEICKSALSKVRAVEHFQANSPMPSTTTYVGDECESGNDHDIELMATIEARVKCLHVANPAKTAFFIATLITHLENNGKR